MASDEVLEQLGRLLRAERWAALASVSPATTPFASMVAYAIDPPSGCLYLHLSRLADHTGNLLANPRASLAIGASDDGRPDPQQLMRASLSGEVEILEREGETYEAGRRLYLARLPESERLFSFPDFILFRLCPQAIRYVGGFGQAYRLEPTALKRALALTAE